MEAAPLDLIRLPLLREEQSQPSDPCSSTLSDKLSSPPPAKHHRSDCSDSVDGRNDAVSSGTPGGVRSDGGSSPTLPLNENDSDGMVLYGILREALDTPEMASARITPAQEETVVGGEEEETLSGSEGEAVGEVRGRDPGLGAPRRQGLARDLRDGRGGRAGLRSSRLQDARLARSPQLSTGRRSRERQRRHEAGSVRLRILGPVPWLWGPIMWQRRW